MSTKKGLKVVKGLGTARKVVLPSGEDTLLSTLKEDSKRVFEEEGILNKNLQYTYCMGYSGSKVQDDAVSISDYLKAQEGKPRLSRVTFLLIVNEVRKKYTRTCTI